MMTRRNAAGVKVGILAMLLSSAALAESPVERGGYLVNGIAACGNCHTMQGPDGPVPGMTLAGGVEINEPGMKAHSSNITQDKETGIGAWTDDQIVIALREGKAPDGSTIGPPMPFEVYRGIADDDARAIVAYLRTVEPVRNEVPESEYAFPLPPAWGPPVGSVSAPDRADKVAYGGYLAGPLGHCTVCHSGVGENGAPDIENKLGLGGMEFKGPWGVTVAPPLTSDHLSRYSDDELKKIITAGERPDGSKLRPPMPVPNYATMTADDVDAIIAYLRTLSRS